ncbi:hypothetical protein Lalb_Chr12g0198951 [Lupinus albus]|uniref:Uncharacterized protein n=1 Tax=Lupinus albus TaxID=3870 RepID=A0A6A4PLH1_LUPAL|nr:hypothetical protein Lalb_Chr12g0198951 [Lupinus albus]
MNSSIARYPSLTLRNMKLSFHTYLRLEQELLRLEKVYQKMIKLKSLLCSIGLKRLVKTQLVTLQ